MEYGFAVESVAPQIIRFGMRLAGLDEVKAIWHVSKPRPAVDEPQQPTVLVGLAVLAPGAGAFPSSVSDLT